MRAVIFYVTREGHTRRIAEHIATDLRRHKHEVELYDVSTVAESIDWPPYDATASFIEPPSLHLADITVPSLHDRTVKLRFTMAGVPLPPFSTTCTPGQALVSVRVNILAFA